MSKKRLKTPDINDMQLSCKHWVSSKNHRALDFKCMSVAKEDFEVVYHMWFMMYQFQMSLYTSSVVSIPWWPVICAKYFLFETKLSLIGSVLGIAADHGPTVQLANLGREGRNDPFTIIIVRFTLTWKGTALDRFPNLGWIISQYFWGVLTFRSGDISVATFLYIKKKR